MCHYLHTIVVVGDDKAFDKDNFVTLLQQIIGANNAPSFYVVLHCKDEFMVCAAKVACEDVQKSASKLRQYNLLIHYVKPPPAKNTTVMRCHDFYLVVTFGPSKLNISSVFEGPRDKDKFQVDGDVVNECQLPRSIMQYLVTTFVSPTGVVRKCTMLYMHVCTFLRVCIPPVPYM